MGHRRARAIGAGLVLAAVACAPAQNDDAALAGSSGELPSTADGTDAEPDAGAGSSSDGDEPEPEPEPPPTACAEPTDVTGRASTIGEAIALINALPRPVSLDCFLERLERPLKLDATTSKVSLQPAAGHDSPRVFLFDGALVMSIAVDGHPGNTLLEFGERVAPTKSIKGEVQFPVTEPLALDAPLQRVYDGQGSKCRLCHAGESAAPEYPLAFASDALRYREDQDVPLDDLRAQWLTCIRSRQPLRCARLDALFAFGSVQATAFSDELQTIYDYE